MKLIKYNIQFFYQTIHLSLPETEFLLCQAVKSSFYFSCQFYDFCITKSKHKHLLCTYQRMKQTKFRRESSRVTIFQKTKLQQRLSQEHLLYQILKTTLHKYFWCIRVYLHRSILVVIHSISNYLKEYSSISYFRFNLILSLTERSNKFLSVLILS